MLDTGNSVLVVDDIEDVREGIKNILESEGFAVSSAENGLKALKVLDKNKIDLVVSDILMPEMDGIEMCQKIIELHPDMMFILISGGGRQSGSSGSYDYLQAAKKITGIDDVLKKPFDPEELINLIKSKLGNS